MQILECTIQNQTIGTLNFLGFKFSKEYTVDNEKIIVLTKHHANGVASGEVDESGQVNGVTVEEFLTGLPSYFI